MNMIEALTLAKEQPGTRVRPCCWLAISGWVIWGRNPWYWDNKREECFLIDSDTSELPNLLHLDDEAELLGPWEIVKEN